MFLPFGIPISALNSNIYLLINDIYLLKIDVHRPLFEKIKLYKNAMSLETKYKSKDERLKLIDLVI